MPNVSTKDSKYVSVSLDKDDLALLEERIRYLREKTGLRVSIAEAIRHAVRNTSYKREKKSKQSEADE